MFFFEKMVPGQVGRGLKGGGAEAGPPKPPGFGTEGSGHARAKLMPGGLGGAASLHPILLPCGGRLTPCSGFQPTRRRMKPRAGQILNMVFICLRAPGCVP